ncbi:hypothetical protein NUU61_004784 [Penicillium alfredii]|uniref:Uncharacterized protein n=1 Tax=Penicillium alfredii TaxID=1506179 RepID=A0A9W9K6Y2_9EURO|nr:uncharacterized protein NUU61_004784 [Penicillium alfredii]KAJ5095428.1 hypothetical protein NUU61_004784 [Penicillium alfredii]
MKGTSIFQFKSWPKIHQPLPRTPRESQQLLNALTSSFRRQLDHAYPTSESAHHGDRPANADSSTHATNQHLQSILENPLFRIVPPKTPSPDHHALRSIEDQRRLAEEPMVVFDELVASGSVTPSAITSCLKSQLLRTRSRADMKISRTAARIVDWFWASDGTSRQNLLRSRASTTSLTKFMVTEGLHGTVIEWLRMLLSQDLGGPNGRITEGLARQTFSHFLIDFMDAEIRLGQGFSSALDYYLRICQMHASAQSAHPASRKAMLLAAGAHLSRVAMEQKTSIEQVSAAVYDQYRETMSSLSPRSLLSASVALYHPTHPDTQPFLQFVETLPSHKLQSWNDARRDAFFKIGVEALRILIEKNKIRDATSLAQQIQQLLPGKPTSTAPEGSRVSHVSPEEEYLLNRLDLGHMVG